MMRAMVITEPGGPDVLRIQEVAEPVRLIVTLDVDPADAPRPLHRVLEDRGGHLAAVPRDAPRHADVDGKEPH